MKTGILCMLLPLVFLCSCEKAAEEPQDNGEFGVYYNFGTSIQIVDEKGTNLLDPKNDKHYTYDDIDVIEFKGKTAVPYYNSQLDFPKGYSIEKWWKDERDLSAVLGLGFDLSKELTSVKHLRIGKNGKIFQLKAEAKVFEDKNAKPSQLGGKATVTDKVWLDGELVWEGKDLLPAQRNPLITIVIPE